MDKCVNKWMKRLIDKINIWMDKWLNGYIYKHNILTYFIMTTFPFVFSSHFIGSLKEQGVQYSTSSVSSIGSLTPIDKSPLPQWKVINKVSNI